MWRMLPPWNLQYIELRWTTQEHIVVRLRCSEQETVAVLTRWAYSSQLPYGITVAFGVGKKGWIEWTFARDLLRAGLKEQVGTGDVRVEPMPGNPDIVALKLTSPSGEAEFEVDGADVRRILHATDHLVAPGTEHRALNVDKAVNRLLDA